MIPSVTVTVYFGSDEWDGPLSLFNMMDTVVLRIVACMENYHVRLIALVLMSDSEIKKFQSNLREVILLIKYAKDKERLYQILKFLSIGIDVEKVAKRVWNMIWRQLKNGRN